MAYFEDTTISKKETAALLLYAQLEHDNKHIMQEQHHLLQVFGLSIILLSLKQHQGFLFSVRQTSVLSTNSRPVLWQFHALDGFKMQNNYHQEA